MKPVSAAGSSSRSMTLRFPDRIYEGLSERARVLHDSMNHLVVLAVEEMLRRCQVCGGSGRPDGCHLCGKTS